MKTEAKTLLLINTAYSYIKYTVFFLCFAYHCIQLSQHILRYIYQHIETIIKTYDGSLPLTHFLKTHFRQHPKLGSRDRKALSEMAYCWYRCSKGLNDSLSFEEKLQACLVLCGSEGKHIQPFLPAEKQDIAFTPEALFPYDVTLSSGIDKQTWLQSMLMQPKMFIRMRRSKTGILKTLKESEIPFEIIAENTIAMPNSSPVDKLLSDIDYAVQDFSSQQTGNFFNPHKNENWWDCCSGAGGKSLLLMDKEPSINLTVSDTRSSILRNLRERFKLYGHKSPTTYVTDSSDSAQLQKTLGSTLFDGIICDVPCSGSGTWSRTPEQLYFFNADKVNEFSSLQQKIAVNAASYLKPGGTLFYITCSVFNAENETVVNELVKQTGLKLSEQQLINGIQDKADSMFIAVLQKA
jgi:16S rRNA (cytosine967-C5)-methyltransferase